MTGKPQFEHKNPRFSGLMEASRLGFGAYNAAVVAVAGQAEGNDVGSFGLMALLGRGAAAGCGPGQIRIRQMRIPQ
jgi:hypothetical protein